ncbi:hypothetical protein RND81_03G175600 [Saponaria officinalis]|uniref:Protein decapping 5-like n=1 Tax=Saponaria officinalis TaxID=3572 RepID=A0AAW1M6T7_SAPOF
MAAEASKSTADTSVDGGTAATSYVGSVISLTSKSDIRYQGTLCDLDATQATIGLRNVQSFGTEGRRKDGPQVPATDKVYEYIVFRGSDIKDLQVIAGPPKQTAPSIHDDPAIIRSHSIPSTAPSSLPTISATATQAGGSSSNSDTQFLQSGIPRTNYQNSTPLYQSGESWGSWKPSPPPTTSSSAVSGPMYLPGYSGASASVQPQRHPLFQPVQCLPMPSFLLPPLAQQQVLYSNANSSFPTGASNISVVDSSSVMLPKAPPQSLPVISQSTYSPSVSPISSNLMDTNNQPNAIFGSPMPNISLFEHPSSGGSSNSHARVTQSPHLQPAPTVSQTSQMMPKDELVQVPFGSPQQTQARESVTSALVSKSAETQAQPSPLPSSVNPKFSHSAPNYTEEFDFEAMNERFKKEEVWGDLSRNLNKSYDFPEQDNNEVDIRAPDKKQPVYKKDDFFDTLSCNALDRESRSGWTQFSERMRVDTETFGEFSRGRGFQAGHGSGHGGQSRGFQGGRGSGHGRQSRGFPGGRGSGHGGQSRGGYRGRGRGGNVYRAF